MALAEQVSIQPLILPQAITATRGSSVVDLGAIDSDDAVIFLAIGAVTGTNPTLDVKVQGSVKPARVAEWPAGTAAELPLRNGTNDNILLARKFTNSGARQIHAVTVMLKGKGTIASAKKINAELRADNAGAPAGSALGTSADVDPTTISTSAFVPVTFTFATPIELADATIYHLVLSGDYDVSSSNQVLVQVKTVASGGDIEIFDSAWGAVVTTQKMDVVLESYVFADVTGKTFAQATAAQANSVKRLGVLGGDLPRNARLYLTVGGTGSPSFTIAALAVVKGRRQPVSAQA